MYKRQGRDVAELVEIGTIDSCSIGVLIEEYVSVRTSDDDEMEEMTITAAVNRETSLVARPRFEGAKVKKMRSNEDDAEVIDINAYAKATASAIAAHASRVDEALAQITAIVAAQQNPPQAQPEDIIEGNAQVPDNVLPLPIRLARKHLQQGGTE